MATVDVLKASILEELQGAQSEEKQGRFKNALIPEQSAEYFANTLIRISNRQIKKVVME